MKRDRNNNKYKNSTKKMRQLLILMVSTYHPDRDGIAAYTAKMENALKNERVSIKIAANGRDWKKNSFSYIFAIIKKASNSRVDVVHFQLSYFLFGNEYYNGLFPFLLMGLKLLGKKVVITLHDIVRLINVNSNFLRNYTGTRLLYFKKIAFINYTKMICLMAEKVIVHDEIAQDALIQDYCIPEKKIQIIHHGIDQNPSFVNDKLYKKILTDFKNNFIVTYFGFVKYGKGLEDLIKAWKLVKNINAQLFIVGGKPPTNLKDDRFEHLIELVNELGLHDSIHFYGYISNDDLPAYLTATDIFVFPYNQLGNVISSSGALSIVAPYLKPIIATNVPAFLQLKKLGAAIIVERNDVKGLAAAIVDVLNDKEDRYILVDKLSRWLSKISWSETAKKTVKLYGDLM